MKAIILRLTSGLLPHKTYHELTLPVSNNTPSCGTSLKSTKEVMNGALIASNILTNATVDKRVSQEFRKIIEDQAVSDQLRWCAQAGEEDRKTKEDILNLKTN